MRLILIILMLSLCSCCHYNKATNTIYGIGKYKDKDVEMECTSPIKNLIGIGGL